MTYVALWRRSDPQWFSELAKIVEKELWENLDDIEGKVGDLKAKISARLEAAQLRLADSLRRASLRERHAHELHLSCTLLTLASGLGCGLLPAALTPQRP